MKLQEAIDCINENVAYKRPSRRAVRVRARLGKLRQELIARIKKEEPYIRNGVQHANVYPIDNPDFITAMNDIDSAIQDIDKLVSMRNDAEPNYLNVDKLLRKILDNVVDTYRGFQFEDYKATIRRSYSIQLKF